MLQRHGHHQPVRYVVLAVGVTLLALFFFVWMRNWRLLLETIFGAVATAGFLSVLPFKGVEFSIFGIGVLLGAIYFLIREIKKPLVCQT